MSTSSLAPPPTHHSRTKVKCSPFSSASICSDALLALLLLLLLLLSKYSMRHGIMPPEAPH